MNASFFAPHYPNSVPRFGEQPGRLRACHIPVDFTERSLPKFPRRDVFFFLPRRKEMIYFCQKGKKGVTDFVLERTCPEQYPKSEKSGFGS